jgi:hypothetical protein
MVRGRSANEKNDFYENDFSLLVETQARPDARDGALGESATTSSLASSQADLLAPPRAHLSGL